MTYPIIKGETRPETRATYPFSELDVGDCFAAPTVNRNSLSNLATYYSRKLGWKFSIRKVDADTVRVWRIV